MDFNSTLCRQYILPRKHLCMRVITLCLKRDELQIYCLSASSKENSADRGKGL